jgi:hypothetical protein
MDLLRESFSRIYCRIVTSSVRNDPKILDKILSCFICGIESRDEKGASDDERYHQIAMNEIYKVSQRLDGLSRFMGRSFSTLEDLTSDEPYQ